jgi:hypothetical protein
MAPRGKRKAQTESKASALLSALEFISLVQNEKGQIHECHSHINNNTISAFNGILGAGISVREDLNACPHTLRMRDALANCGQELSITQMPNDYLSIPSERFKAIVPCVSKSLLLPIEPDAPCATIDDRIREGFEQIMHITNDKAERVIEASILLKADTMIATNGKVILEYWHGINLPPQLAIPKIAAATICKVKKPLVKLGFSASSVTFYFDDNSWVRTQRYVEEWPNTDKVLNVVCYPEDIPIALFPAVDSVAAFSDDEKIFFRGNKIQSHASENVGASYEIDGFDANVQLNYKFIKQSQEHMRKADFKVRNGAIFFFGNKTRGAIAAIHENQTNV